MKVTSPPSSRWVPTTTSTEPSASPARTSRAWALVRNRLQHLDPDREGRVAVGEGLGVLAGQQGGGHQHGRLVAVLHGLEHGPDGHLGLAEPHVAADQAVHRLGPLHVGLHVLDGPELVGGLDEGERRLQLGLPRGVGPEGVAGRPARRRRYRATSSSAISCTAARALDRARCHSDPPSRLTVGESPPA